MRNQSKIDHPVNTEFKIRVIIKFMAIALLATSLLGFLLNWADLRRTVQWLDWWLLGITLAIAGWFIGGVLLGKAGKEALKRSLIEWGRPLLWLLVSLLLTYRSTWWQ